MSAPGDAVLLCEGVHDRAFLDGLLRRLGCAAVDRDREGRAIGRAHLGFRSPGGRLVRVVPCAGDRGVNRAIALWLERSRTEDATDLVACWDSDQPAGKDVGRSRARDRLRNVGRAFDPGATFRGTGFVARGITVQSALWWTPDPPSPLLPEKQTLERLVCAALAERAPARAEAVLRWLEARPDRPTDRRSHTPKADSPKSFAWSHMAGWLPDAGSDGFYGAVWGRSQGAPDELEDRLRRIGAWEVLAGVVG